MASRAGYSTFLFKVLNVLRVLHVLHVLHVELFIWIGTSHLDKIQAEQCHTAFILFHRTFRQVLTTKQFTHILLERPPCHEMSGHVTRYFTVGGTAAS